MLEREIPRRDFIKYWLVGAGALILASCARRKELPQPQVTVEVTPALEPTLEPTVTPTEVGVPEPIVGLPESLDKAQIIDVEDLPEFLPKLVAKLHEYHDQAGWPENQYIYPQGQILKTDGLPDRAWIFYTGDGSNGEKVKLTLGYWGRIKMADGSFVELISVPGRTSRDTDKNKNIITTFFYTPDVMTDFEENKGTFDKYKDTILPDKIFERFKKGQNGGLLLPFYYTEPQQITEPNLLRLYKIYGYDPSGILKILSLKSAPDKYNEAVEALEKIGIVTVNLSFN
jgi:hypothetical protein